MNLNYSLKEINLASEFIISNSRTNRFLFFGPVGIGKTTLIKKLCLDLGVRDLVTSPTFSVINQYKTNNDFIYHMDLFRLEKVDEITDAGIIEYLDQGKKLIIEWPEILLENFNFNCTKINMEIIDEKNRKLHLKNEFF